MPYFQGIDVAEFNFAPYVQQMKDKGVKMVVYTGPYQNTVKIQQAMQQQGMDAMFMQDSTVYDQGYIDQAGSLADGMFVYSTTELFTSNNPEMKLYRAWLDQVAPGANPNFFGLYAWSAARLFVQQAVALGGELNRAVADRLAEEGQELDQQRHPRTSAGRHQDHSRVLQDLPVQRVVEAGLRWRLPVLPPHQRRLSRSRTESWTS